jgi:hypothetical protein
MLDILQKKGALDNLIFVDETTLEAVPHPKGMPTKAWSARRPVS